MQFDFGEIRGGRCSECGSSNGFDELHPRSKTTCSPKCRKRRERRQKLAKASYGWFMREMMPLRDSVKKGEDLEEYRRILQAMKAEINDLLALAKDNDTLEARAMFEAHKRQQNLPLP